MTAATVPPRPRHLRAESAPECPYVGLVPFRERDAEFFFGRERESEIIIANLAAAKLTLLYAPSGVGKSSVLCAGVVPRLRQLLVEDDDDDLEACGGAVAYLSEWSSRPLETAAARISSAVRDATSTISPLPNTDPPPPLSLEWLRELMERHQLGRFYLILDQFEEYFFYNPVEDDTNSLTATLSEILTARDLNIHVLLSIREDSLASLDRFKGRVPHLFGNYLRLTHLDQDAARVAIEGPLDRYNELVPADDEFRVEPAMIEALLRQVTTGQVTVGPDDATRDIAAPDQRGDIETPYLQLVLTRLWMEERARGSATLRLGTLTDLGGAQTIVRSHLETVMAGLPAAQIQVAAAVFHHLVTTSGSKIALTAMDLADWSGQSERAVQELLESLSSGPQRILRPVPPAAGFTGPPRYEIFHDVMGAAVLDWRRRYVAEQQLLEQQRDLIEQREQAVREARAARRRLRLTLATVGVVVLAIVLVAAIVLVIKSQGTVAAQRQARLGEAAAALSGDPDLSLGKAMEAYQLGDDAVSRSAVLAAASSPHSELIAGPDGADTPMTVAGIEPTADRAHLVAFDAAGRLLVLDGTGAQQSVAAVTGLAGTVTGIGVAPDASRVVVTTDKGELTVVDMQSGAQTVIDPGWTVGSTVSWIGPAQGGLVLAVSTSGSAATFDPSSGQQVVHFDADVYEAVGADGGDRVATTGAERTLRLWDSRTGELLSESSVFDVAPSFVQTVDTSVVGIITTYSGGAPKLVVWDWLAGTSPTYELLRANQVTSLVVNSSAKSVQVAFDKQVWTFDLESGNALWYSPQQDDWIMDTSFSRDGSWLATAGADGRVLVWLASSAADPVRPTYELMADDGIVQRVAFLDDGKVISLAADGSLRRWVLPVADRFTEKNWMLTIDLSSDGHYLAAAGAYGYGYILDPARLNGAVGESDYQAWYGDGLTIRAQRFDPTDPHRVLTLSDYANAPQMWTWSSGAESSKPITFDPAQLAGLNTLASLDISSDGKIVAAGDYEGAVHFWDAGTGRLLPDRTIAGTGYPAYDIGFDPSGQQLAVTARAGLRLVDLATRNETLLAQSNPLHLAFDPTGNSVAAIAGAGSVRIFSRDGTVIQDLAAHDSSLGEAAFSSDGKMLAVGTGEGFVQVWDVQSGTLLTLTRQHGDLVNDVLFAPGQGTTLISASDDATVASWQCAGCADPGAVLANPLSEWAAG